tara:strand:+ start:1450 stop:2295 length:846 start_codon:yes stop_codon:yes gene_type:complete
MINWDEIPIKERKNVLRKLNKGKSREQKTDLLYNAYKGLECVCLTTGPSLLDYPEEEINKFCEGRVVVSIKTASLKFKNVTDICVTNYYNSYKFSNNEPFLILARQETPIWHNNWVNKNLVTEESYSNFFPFQPDILWGCDNTVGHSKSVCYANRWEDNELTKQKTNRILGPGVLNDLAIPVMVHLGVKKVYFLGWHGSRLNNQGKLDYAYKIENKHKPNLNAIKESLDCRILKSDTSKDECSLITESELDILEYFNKKQIEVSILSKNSEIDKKFKREQI